ncbi:MAG: PHP-associated domain-containing protein [Acidimicrobiales bacterium]|jgi:predicted metal-dependent phosphoesterase TrpH
MLRVDCHLHTMWSGDSTTTPEELAAAVHESAIDVLCITDHGTINGALRLSGELDCRVVIGQEQRTPDGEVIGLFLSERIPSGCRNAREAAEHIRAQGGLVYVPHPYDPLRHRLNRDVLEQLAADGLVDLVEARNAKTSLEHLNAEAAATAARLGLAAGAGSDSHVPDAIGAAYVEVGWYEGAAGFLEVVRRGRVVGHHFDRARSWRGRIVPSTAGG